MAPTRACFNALDIAPLHVAAVKTEEDLQALLQGSYLAVGVTLLYSNPALTPAAERVVLLLKEKKPVARTMTFFIYDFTQPTALAAKP